MVLIILLYICLLNIFTDERVFSVKPKSPETQRRIVHGKDANIEDYPFMAFILIKLPESSDDKFQSCGGTILDAKHILTAAHCVGICMLDGQIQNTCQRLTPDKILAFVGVTNPIQIQKSNLVHVKQIYVHPNFRPIAKAHECIARFDFAVLVLKHRIKFNEKVSPVTLPEAVNVENISGSKIHAYGEDGKLCTVLGWGLMDEHIPSKSLNICLQVTHVPLIDQVTCTKYTRLEPGILSPFCNDTHICTMDPLNETGICFGDSGGPILCGGVQVGVVSTGEHCTGPNIPNMYARTDIVMDWLQEIIKFTSNARITHLNRFLLFIYCLIINVLR